MEPNQKAFALLVLFGTAALKVYGCVCYVGQEPERGGGKRYGWSLAEQRPCECTEFRLGGVNMKPEIKPFEVKIGEDDRVSINEQGQIIQPLDCTEDETTFPSTSLRAQNTHQVNGIMELQLPMTSPMRLEFTVNGGGKVYVFFSPNGPGVDEALYRIILFTDGHYFGKWESSGRWWRGTRLRTGVNYIGVPVSITYDNGRFEVAVQGVRQSIQTYDVTPPPPSRWFVSFETNYNVNFTEPCINDFDPQFKPQ